MVNRKTTKNGRPRASQASIVEVSCTEVSVKEVEITVPSSCRSRNSMAGRLNTT